MTLPRKRRERKGSHFFALSCTQLGFPHTQDRERLVISHPSPKAVGTASQLRNEFFRERGKVGLQFFALSLLPPPKISLRGRFSFVKVSCFPSSPKRGKIVWACQRFFPNGIRCLFFSQEIESIFFFFLVESSSSFLSFFLRHQLFSRIRKYNQTKRRGKVIMNRYHLENQELRKRRKMIKRLPFIVVSPSLPFATIFR